MSKKYLLDTNIVIDFLKGNNGTVDVIKKIIKGQFYISAIVLGEYYYGAFRSQNTQNQLELFEVFCKRMKITILPVDRDVMVEYAKLQAYFSKKGKLKPIFDLLITSSCIANNCILVTRNKKDFAGIESLKIIS